MKGQFYATKRTLKATHEITDNKEATHTVISKIDELDIALYGEPEFTMIVNLLA